MHHIKCVFIGLTWAVSLSLQCPQGWSHSTIDPTKCYFVSVQKKIWLEAESYCSRTAPNAHLTSISSAFESIALNAVVMDTSNVAVCGQFWIGANDLDQNGRFIWSDGRPFSYTKWATGQPNISNQCVSSLARTTGEWKTELCGTENCFICESYSNSQTTSAFSPTTTSMTTGNFSSMTDCYDWLHFGGATVSGIYTIYPPGIKPFQVLCDMATNGGGYTVFQKRINDAEIFWNRTWVDYKKGFGTISSNNNFWLGLDGIHLLTTKDATVSLRIDLRGNRCSDPVGCDIFGGTTFDPNGIWFEEWIFSVDNEASNFTFHVSTPTAGNLSKNGDVNDNLHYYSNSQVFSTIDRSTTGCVFNRNLGHKCKMFSAWWYSRDKGCGGVFLNGKYVGPDAGFYGGSGFAYHRQKNSFEDYWINPVQSEMKLRRNV